MDAHSGVSPQRNTARLILFFLAIISIPIRKIIFEMTMLSKGLLILSLLRRRIRTELPCFGGIMTYTISPNSFHLDPGMIKRMRSGTGLSSNKIKNVSRLRLKGRSMEDAIFSPMQV